MRLRNKKLGLRKGSFEYDVNKGELVKVKNYRLVAYKYCFVLSVFILTFVFTVILTLNFVASEFAYYIVSGVSFFFIMYFFKYGASIIYNLKQKPFKGLKQREPAKNEEQIGDVE